MPMRPLLAALFVSLSVGSAEAGEEAVLPEMIASSIENNYSQLKCFSAKYRVEYLNLLVNEDTKIESELKGGGSIKGVVQRKTSRFSTLLFSGSDFKAITESGDGEFLISLTKKDDVYFTYALPEEGQKYGTAWKRSLKDMRGNVNPDPRVSGLEEFRENYPQILRTCKIIYVKKLDSRKGSGGIFDVCIERPNGGRSLISFDSLMNFLPVRNASIENNEFYYRVTTFAYEKKGKNIWFPSLIVEKSTMERFKKLEDLERETEKLVGSCTTSLVDFKVHDCGEISGKVSPVSFPVGTEVRDSTTNSIYYIGDKEFEEAPGFQQQPFGFRIALWLFAGVAVCAVAIYFLQRAFSRN